MTYICSFPRKLKAHTSPAYFYILKIYTSISMYFSHQACSGRAAAKLKPALGECTLMQHTPYSHTGRTLSAPGDIDHAENSGVCGTVISLQGSSSASARASGIKMPQEPSLALSYVAYIACFPNSATCLAELHQWNRTLACLSGPLDGSDEGLAALSAAQCLVCNYERGHKLALCSAV